MSPQQPPAPVGLGSDSRRVRVAAMSLVVLGVAVAAAGAALLGRLEFLARLSGTLLYILSEVGLAAITLRAMVRRAEFFAVWGVPRSWTRYPLRGVQDVTLRRWENMIRELRAPWPDERDVVLTAARARSAGLLLIVLPGLLAALLAVVGFVMTVRADVQLWAFALIPSVGGIVCGWAALRYLEDGYRAQVYLTRFSTPAEPASHAS